MVVVVGGGGVARAAEVRGGARGSGLSTQEWEEVAASESKETRLLFVEAQAQFGIHNSAPFVRNAAWGYGWWWVWGWNVREREKALLKKAIGSRKKLFRV